jgi:hypothetical protein
LKAKDGDADDGAGKDDDPRRLAVEVDGVAGEDQIRPQAGVGSET